MKFIFFLIALVPVVLCDRLTEHIVTAQEHVRLCQEESGVSQEVLDASRAGEDVDDPKYKDYLFCFLKKMELQNENGDVIIQNFRELLTGHFSPARVEQILKQCATKKGDAPSETAFLVFRCYQSASPADHVSSSSRS